MRHTANENEGGHVRTIATMTIASNGAVCSASPCPWSKAKRVRLPSSLFDRIRLAMPGVVGVMRSARLRASPGAIVLLADAHIAEQSPSRILRGRDSTFLH